MATTESSELFCLVCNLRLEITSCANIFYTSLPRNGELLVSFVLRVLCSAESDLRSSYVCSRCYNLFQMLEQAQWTAANIRCEILKVYRSGDRKKIITKEIVNDNTETTILDVDHKIFMEHFIQDDKLVIANTLNQLKDISSVRSVNNEASQSIERRAIAENHLNGQNLNVSNVDISIRNLKVVDEVSLKCNTKNLLVPDNARSNISNVMNISKEQNNCIKTEKLNIESNNKGVIGNEISNYIIDSTDLSVMKEETFNKSFKTMTRLLTNDATTTSLSRQEKMALYVEQCRMCSRLFKSTNDLELHLLKHGGSRPYQCRKCEERFSDISLANIHAIEMHIEDKSIINVATEPYKGETVDFTNDDCIFPEEVLRMSDNEEQDDFEWKERNDITVEITENSENIKGNQLNQKNSSFDAHKQISDSFQASWTSGRISKYSLKPFKHSCPTCGKKWRTSAELKTHMKSHSSLRPYMCEKCGQAYKHKHALEIHIGMHNGINPFQCSFCNKCFTQKGALMRHLPMHTGETPYQCELCGKRFVHHTSYNMHALSHTGKKSYRCHICDLSLLSTSHLKRHMRVHTGERPYTCSLCGKRFAERYNLFAHQKIHDPAEIMAKGAKKMQYKCEQCMMLFDKKQKLDDHVKHQHSLGIDARNDRKWIDTTVNIDPQQVIELTKFYTPQSQNQNSIKMDSQDNLTVGQTWQQLNCQRLQNIDSVTKVLQSQNTLTQIDGNSLTVTLDNHRILMEDSYTRNLLPNTRALSEHHISTDRTHI